jgi:beta-lactamase regulating signal transducer with metallopeptidase domain/outer membrane protein assembly factor BamB
MSSLQNLAALWISPSAVSQLGWTLVHSLWQLLLIALVTNLLADVMGRRSAALRHGVLVIGLFAMGLAPGWTWWRLGPNPELQPAAAPAVESVPAQGSAVKPTPRTVSSATQASVAAAAPLRIPSQPSADVRHSTENSSFATSSWRITGERALEKTLPWVVGAWWVGVAFFALRPLIGWWNLRRLRRRQLSPASVLALRALDRATVLIGQRTAVQLYESACVRMPIVLGYLRPVILLPASLATSLSPQHLEAILLHELAHIRRHDFVINLLQTLIETVLFYHPAVWWISKRIREEREHCCDDIAATICGDRVEYARALLELDQWCDAESVLALGAGGSSLFFRVRRLFDATAELQDRRVSFPIAQAISLALSIGVILGAQHYGLPTARAQIEDGPALQVAAQSASDQWLQWGGSPARNNVSSVQGLPTQWKRNDQHTRWSIPLGSQTYSSPVIAAGKVLIGTNNGAGRDPAIPATEDRSCLQCFDEATGALLWQYASAKLPAGRLQDWPLIGLCSTPCVVDDRIWVVTNRCEVLCLDLNGFGDGENDGPYCDEPNSGKQAADIVWRFDMLAQLGVTPHHQSCSSPTVAGGLVLLNTGFSPAGRDPKTVPAGPASPPSFLALDIKTGQVVWSRATPAEMLPPHECFGSSPAVGVIAGTAQAIFAHGDGWVYAFDFERLRKGETAELWRFDANPKTAVRQLGHKGRRNAILAPPVVADNHVYIVTGQNPEHGEGEADLWCVDATRRGDLSAEQVFHSTRPEAPLPPRPDVACDPARGEVTRKNPGSGVIWHFSQRDLSGDGKIEFSETLHRTLAAPVIHQGCVFVADAAGILFCFEQSSGRLLWSDDLFSAVWGTPLVADGKLFVVTEQGEVRVYLAGPRRDRLAVNAMEEAMYGTPAAANGTLFIASSKHLTAVATQVARPAAQPEKANDDERAPSAAASERGTNPAPPQGEPGATQAGSTLATEKGLGDGAELLAGKALDPAVAKALENARKFLHTCQDVDGSWKMSPPSDLIDPSLTALSLLALLRAGEPADSDVMKRGLNILSIRQPDSTYCVALRIIARCTQANFDKQEVERDVAWLADAQCRTGNATGGWSYTRTPATRGDGSCTRFAVWALDVARSRGVSAPEETWRRVAEFWLSSQTRNGGWSYIPQQGAATENMTLAGIAGLEAVRGAVADDDLHRRIDAAVEKAWAHWQPALPAPDKWLAPTRNYPFYSLHALSLAGHLSRKERIGEVDWESQVFAALLAAQNPKTGEWRAANGESEIVSTALAILILQPREASHRKPVTP